MEAPAETYARLYSDMLRARGPDREWRRTELTVIEVTGKTEQYWRQMLQDDPASPSRGGVRRLGRFTAARTRFIAAAGGGDGSGHLRRSLLLLWLMMLNSRILMSDLVPHWERTSGMEITVRSGLFRRRTLLTPPPCEPRGRGAP